MTSLPVMYDGLEQVCVIDPDSGELVSLASASDHAIAHAADVLHVHDGEVLALKRSLAAEMRSRHGVGKACVGGYELTVSESQSWPIGAVKLALVDLEASGTITRAEAEKCLPLKPKPDARQIKALLNRLVVSDPEAARILADACTLSAASLREIRRAALDEASA